MNPVLALIIANVIWGAASPIFKYALVNIPPFTLAAIRFIFAAILLLPFIKTIKFNLLTKREWLELFLGSFFGIFINITFFFFGLKNAKSINAPIIASAGPVFLYLFSTMFLGEKPNRRVLVGMLISLIGVLVIILSPIFLEGQKLELGEVKGNIFFVIATIGGVLYPIFYKNVVKKLDIIRTTFLGFVMSIFMFLPFMLYEFRSWSFSSLNIPGWTGIIFGVIFASLIAYFFYNFGIAILKTQEIGLFAYIDPVAAIIIAVPLLHEYPNLYFFIGTALVLGGIFFAENRIHWHPFDKLKVHSS